MLHKNSLAHILKSQAELDETLIDVLYEAIEAVAVMYGRLRTIRFKEEIARKKERCCGSVFTDKKGYVYANHGVHDVCPMHGQHPKHPGEKRLRKYIGHWDGDEASYLHIAVRQYEEWMQIKDELGRELEAYHRTIGYIKQIPDATKLRSYWHVYS